MPAASARAEEHVWTRYVAVWHVAFAVLLALTVVLVAFDPGLPSRRRIVVLVLLAAIGGWYAAVGARVFGADWLRLGLLYVLVVLPLVGAAFALDGTVGVLLFTIYPQLWAMLPTRRAVVANVALTVGLAAILVTTQQEQPAVAVASSAVSLLVSLALGLWIGRIIDQSADRAEVISELEEARAELATVSHRAGVLAERERLSGEIHDTLAQGLASVLMLLQVTEAELGTDPDAARRHLASAQDTVRQNLAEARSLVEALGPVDLQAVSLPEAVGRLVARFDEQPGVTARLDVRGRARGLPANVEVVLLRAVQEGLANVRKHAAARRVTVSLCYDEDGTGVEVADDGRGFGADGAPGGFGLAGMRRRAEEAGGAMLVSSRPGHGTTVAVRLP